MMSETVNLYVGAGAQAFSTLRSFGGEASQGDAYAGFNVCHYTGDDPEHVAWCRRVLAQFMGVATLIIPRQTHSVNVAVIGDEVIIGDEMPDLEGVDALVTRRDDVALVINTADCLPVVFNDPEAGVTGIAHAGWRGLYDGVIERTVETMQRLGASRSAMRAAIGPCICGACYEVDWDFARRFAERFGEGVVDGSGVKPHVDLRAAALIALGREGIGDDRVEVATECSRCDNRLFSARRMGVSSGRIATVVRKIKKN